MRRRGKIRGPVARLVLALAVLSPLAGDASRSDQPAGRCLVVLANKERAEDSITLVELRQTFLGARRFWSDGTPIHSVLPPRDQAELSARFVREILEMEFEGFRRHWAANLFRGLNSREPKSFSTTLETLRAVAQSTIPLALVDQEQMPEKAPGVKVLTVEGRGPSDPAYPLRFAAD